MLKSVFAVVMLGAVAVLGGSPGTRVPDITTARFAAEQICFRGHIVLVEGSQLVVSIGEQYTRFLVADDASVRLDGVEATLDVLEPDYAVTIRAETKGQELIAKHIEAITRI